MHLKKHLENQILGVCQFYLNYYPVYSLSANQENIFTAKRKAWYFANVNQTFMLFEGTTYIYKTHVAKLNQLKFKIKIMFYHAQLLMILKSTQIA